MRFVDRVPPPATLRALARWIAVACLFAGLGVGSLYLLVEGAGIGLVPATLIAGELLTIARFFANEWWVFRVRDREAMVGRLLKFHATVAASFAIWSLVTIALGRWNVHFVLASLAGNAATAGWSVLINFGWVWRTRVPS